MVPKPNSPPEEKIVKRLDGIVALLLLQAEDQERAIEALRRVGFLEVEIATLTGLADRTLRMRKARKRENQGGKKKTDD